jgi:hypothetical protein
MKTREEQPGTDIKRPGKQLFLAAVVCGCLGLAGWIGYWFGANRGSSEVYMSAQRKVPFQAFLLGQSFSEIDNTKAKLKALSSEFLSDVEARHHAGPASSFTNLPRHNPLYAVHPEQAVTELEQGIAQFQSNEAEMMVVQELLRLLKREKMGDHWLDVYLAALYRHPADPLIVRYAKEAVAISYDRQRQKELSEALMLVKRVSPELPIAPETLAQLESEFHPALATRTALLSVEGVRKPLTLVQ